MRVPNLFLSFGLLSVALSAGCDGAVKAPVAFAEGASAAAETSSRQLPEGVYACSLYSGGMLMGFGDIEIDGARYRGPGYDGEFPDGWNGYVLSEEGAVIWNGKLGGLDSDGNSVVSSVLKTSDQGAIFIRVLVMTDSGNTQTIDCELEA